MTFERQAIEKWRDEVPGARWFKADLQVHAIDDHPGGKVTMPADLADGPAEPLTLTDYARRFLRSAVDRGVQVVGLTPHSPRARGGSDTSAVWRIVEEWNEGTDDDGVPFREKIYAVFPGFEPSFREGKAGLHLLFLFDPEIGRERYLKAFDLAMNGAEPWKNNELRPSELRADECFRKLRKFRKSECTVGGDDAREWSYLILAPHADSGKGLLGAHQAQIRKSFPHEEISGFELGEGKLPEDLLRNYSWLRDAVRKHRQAFFHASDACKLDDIGHRHTWIKLASPRVEALRQAFIASDSRMRIGFEKDASGALREIDNPPDVQVNEHPWLKEVNICGGGSFFGGTEDGKPRNTRFRFSPDLTCIIGGSMTGKSTLVDGLRIHVGAALPVNETIRGQVEARGRNVFGAGTLGIDLDCPGTNHATPFDERWPAQFFAQNELQRLSQENAAVEDVLARLVPSETGNIKSRDDRMRDLEAQLSDCVRQLRKLDEQHADMEQACERARAAKRELAVFSETGVKALQQAGRDRQIWTESNRAAESVAQSIREAVAAVDIHQIEGSLAEKLASMGHGSEDLNLNGLRARIEASLRDAEREANAWSDVAETVVEVLKKKETELRPAVERALADRGLDAARLKEVQDLNRRASLLSSYESELERVEDRRAKTEKMFADLREERHSVVFEQRKAFGRVVKEIKQEFGDWIRVRRVDNGDSRPLEQFLETLRQKGITRWWNGMDSDRKPSPDTLIENLKSHSLDEVGMSEAVQVTFEECITRSKERELTALHCPDTYVLEMRMDDGAYRRIDELSGGQRVSVLLSLLLETADDRPLVIDQPEDELDNRFLFDTVLPALKKLRGRRQVIVATHNANIVVNGDADMVIQLDATARRGWAACVGAIEEPAVREAIVRTVDGGEEAFRLRRRKYGF